MKYGPTAKRPRRRTGVVANAEPVTASGAERNYTVTLRTDGAEITATRPDRGLYPKAVTWNRLLGSDEGRYANPENEKYSWRKTGRRTFLEFADSGSIDRQRAEARFAARPDQRF